MHAKYSGNTSYLLFLSSSYLFLFPQDVEDGGASGVIRIGSRPSSRNTSLTTKQPRWNLILDHRSPTIPRFILIASSLVNDSSYISTGIFRSDVTEICANASANCSHTRCMRIEILLFSLFWMLLSVTSLGIFLSSNSSSSFVCRGYPTTYTSARSLIPTFTISRINSTLDLPFTKYTFQRSRSVTTAGYRYTGFRETIIDAQRSSSGKLFVYWTVLCRPIHFLAQQRPTVVVVLDTNSSKNTNARFI